MSSGHFFFKKASSLLILSCGPDTYLFLLLSLSPLPPSLYSVFQENQKLREQNDELNGQILSLSLYEAKTLFATQTKAQSLAAEIDNASRDQVKLRQDTVYT